MNRSAHGIMRAWCGCLVVGGLACGDGLTIGEIDPDAGVDRGELQDEPDDEDPDGDDPATDDGDPEALQVSLLVEPVAASEDNPCSTNCANVTAEVGEALDGLSYRWSDPALSGKGPHRVCTSEPSLDVRVEVESPAVDGEFGSEPRRGNASTRVEQPEYCACMETSVEHPTELFTMPEAGVHYQVCTGNPKHVADAENDENPYSMFMYAGDSFAYPLKRHILPGEQGYIGYYLSTYLSLRIYAAQGACGSVRQELIGGHFDDGVAQKEFSHLVFEAYGTPPEPIWPFPKTDWLSLRDFEVTWRCTPPDGF